MPKRAAIALVVVFALTRVVSLWLAYSPDLYRGDTDVAGDVGFYHYYSSQIVDGDQALYSEVEVEYPPGSLVLITAPYLVSSDLETYRVLFAIEMVVVDALGVVALMVLGRRWRSYWGVWAWVLLIPFLGPIAHVRLDLVPAVLTIWAFERAAANRWLESGAAIGIGTAVKLYPIALLPILFFVAIRKRQLVVGAALPLIAALLPYIAHLGELMDSVIGYHSGRGIQVESTWGLGLMLATNLGLEATAAYNFGAFHVASSASRALDTLSTLLSAAGAAIVWWFSYKRLRRGDVRSASLMAFGLMCVLMTVAAVWSPQYLLWIIALAAVALAARGDDLLYVAYGLAAAGVVSQIAYPFQYNALLEGNALLALLLLARNLGVLALGVSVLLSVLRPRSPAAAAA